MSLHNYHIDTDPGPQLEEKLQISILNDGSAVPPSAQGDRSGHGAATRPLHHDDQVQYMRSKVYHQAPVIDEEKYCALLQKQVKSNEKSNKNKHQANKESMASNAILLQNDEEINKSNRISVLSQLSNQNGCTFDR